MSTPIEALAQEYAEANYIPQFVSVPKLKAAFEAGAKAASGRVAELEREVESLKLDFSRLEDEVMFNQKYSQHGEQMINEIMTAAKTSHRRATMCAKGQTITASDFLENHVIWAAIAHTKALSGAGKGEGHG